MEKDLSYETILRIKRGIADPGYSKVERLAEKLGIKYSIKRPRKPTPQEASHG